MTDLVQVLKQVSAYRSEVQKDQEFVEKEEKIQSAFGTDEKRN